MVVLYRIDNRLLHGQVLEAWLPATGANCMGIVSDETAGDPVRQRVLTLCVPEGVRAYFWGVAEAPEVLRKLEADPSARALILFPRPHEVNAVLEGGAPVPAQVNVGGMHYAIGKLSLGRYVTFSEEDRRELKRLLERGIQLDARATPHDAPVDFAATVGLP
jgi:mannose/fructose/N-acetylgalactosamine-specific phosphotransferase system component IIB